jgi:hypothetical protein
MFKLTGTIKMVSPTVQVSEKFSKREFVVTDTTSMYPQDIMFQLTQDKCSMLDSIIEGQQVEVSFNLRGREWVSPQGETKYFNTLEAWRIEGQASAPRAAAPQASPAAQPASPAAGTTEEDDDLPF